MNGHHNHVDHSPSTVSVVALALQSHIWVYAVSEVSLHTDFTLPPSDPDVNLILALTTATYNNLQRHWWWYVWSPTHAHAPDPVAGPTTLHLCGVQVAPRPVKISFHCRCSIKVLAGALLDSDPGSVNCLTGCKKPVIRLHACAGHEDGASAVSASEPCVPEVSSRGFTRTACESSFLLPPPSSPPLLPFVFPSAFN